MKFDDDMIAALQGNAASEIDVLIAASRVTFQTATNTADPIPALSLAEMSADTDRLFEIARFNKMLGWLPLAARNLPQGCAALAPRLLQTHLQTVDMNRRAMAVTTEVVRTLTKQELRHVVLKGPFQQLVVHGQPFRRPSGDIDLFVRPRDRARASALLQDLGFAPLEQDRAAWWIGFLGEQHFQRATDGAVVDLHHRLQQAGLPDWRKADRVLDRGVRVRADGSQESTGNDPAGKNGTIPVLSAVDGCLLMAVTLAKALLGREPCGWAAAELAHWLTRLDARDRAALAEVARASGQDGTLALGLTLVAACYDLDPAQQWGSALVSVRLNGLTADAAELRDLVFQPWQRRDRAPRRREMLRMLAAGRPHVLAVEGVRAMLSPLVLARLERRRKT